MKRLQIWALATIVLAAGYTASAQSAKQDKALAELPPAPVPVYTEPLFIRPTLHNYAKGRSSILNPLAIYEQQVADKASFINSPRLENLVKDGKILLSLNDAIALALENNYDIAIARYNLDIADTDILRARAGSDLRGVSTGLVVNTLGGSTSTLTSGGGPGGTSGGSGGAASGTSGIVLSTNGAGTVPENLDPYLTGTLQWERTYTPTTNVIYGGNTNTNEYNFGYNQGFLTGTSAALTFNNSRTTTSNSFSIYSPDLSSSLKIQVTQHLLQGLGTGINGRFIVEAINDRRITDSSFRQQILYTVNQVENIYWGLVSAYEDVQAKQRALNQSTKLTADNRKQLEIGTLAPLDVVNSDSAVATDQQSLIASQSNLQYQQIILKQAIARNLTDQILVGAPVIPTDRINFDETTAETQSVDELVQKAFQHRPEIEQAVLSIENDKLTLKGLKNGLLPTLDVYAFYTSAAVAGSKNPNSGTAVPTHTYGDALDDVFTGKTPDKGIGFNLNIPLRNRTAVADQARSQLEYRQAQMRLEQLYTQVRMQVLNAQLSLKNDRAQVKAAQAARDYAQQSLDAELKKLHLGASTTASVLQQERNLASGENSLLAAQATYAKDRAAFFQVTASTLEVYGINFNEAVTGNVTAAPVVPGLHAAAPAK
jgi:outer membrane protein TolC